MMREDSGPIRYTLTLNPLRQKIKISVSDLQNPLKSIFPVMREKRKVRPSRYRLWHSELLDFQSSNSLFNLFSGNYIFVEFYNSEFTTVVLRRNVVFLMPFNTNMREQTQNSGKMSIENFEQLGENWDIMNDIRGKYR